MRKALGVFLLCLAGSVQATLIDNDSFTTDDVSGLDWLDLTETSAMTMVDALAANPGWRFATNAEVEDLFGQLFDGFYETSFDGKYWDGTSATGEGEYADQEEDTHAFHALFGTTLFGNVLYATRGLYYDENAVVTNMGASWDPNGTPGGRIWGMDTPYSNPDYESIDNPSPITSTYLVRTSVPIPTAIEINIRPGDSANFIDTTLPDSKLINVGIMSTSEFDATQVVGTTVRFGPGAAEPADPAGVVKDLDGDGDNDFRLRFPLGETGIACEEPDDPVLTGQLGTGEIIEGSDFVTTPDCPTGVCHP
jgi:hypothetical protein